MISSYLRKKPNRQTFSSKNNQCVIFTRGPSPVSAWVMGIYSQCERSISQISDTQWSLTPGAHSCRASHLAMGMQTLRQRPLHFPFQEPWSWKNFCLVLLSRVPYHHPPRCAPPTPSHPSFSKLLLLSWQKPSLNPLTSAGLCFFSLLFLFSFYNGPSKFITADGPVQNPGAGGRSLLSSLRDSESWLAALGILKQSCPIRRNIRHFPPEPH